MAYPTRVYSSERILPRHEPVVYGNGDQHNILSRDELNFFADNGYLIKPGLLADKVDGLLREIPVLKEKLAGRKDLILEPENHEVRSVFSPDLYSELYRQLATDDHLLLASEQILDSEVYLHHARINVKAGLSGKSFPWHSDFETWHSEDGVPGMRILTGWVFLTENNEFNGSLLAIPGSHKHFISCVGETPENNYQTSLKNQMVGVPSKNSLAEMVNDFGLKGIFGPPGTVVFHEGNLLHGSSDNISPIDRTNVFFVYNSVHNTPVAPFNGLAPRPEFLARPFKGALKQK